MVEASVVLVSFGSESTLGAAVESVPSHMEVVVVEQSRSGHAADVVRAARPDALVIRAGANRGFGAGCNLGAANASGRVLIFLNPDAAFLGGAADVLTQSALEGFLVGPALEDADGSVVTEPRYLSRPARDVADLILPKRLVPAWLKRAMPVTEAGGIDGPVGYVQGACMAVRRDDFFAVDGFDERFFLYGEEEHLARRLADVGVSSKIVGGARVRHIGQTSSEAVGDFAVEQLFRSQMLLYRDHLHPLAFRVGSAAVFAAVLLLWISAPVRMPLRLRTPYSESWCRAALRGLSAGWLRRPVLPPSRAFGGGDAPEYWSDSFRTMA